MNQKDLEKKIEELMLQMNILREKNAEYEREAAEAAAEEKRKAEIGKVRSAYANVEKDHAVAFAKEHGFVADATAIRLELRGLGYQVELLDTPKKRKIRRK